MRSLVLCSLVAGLVLGCGGDDLLLPGDGAATRIAIAGGDGQAGAVGATLAESIYVLVSDATGRPVMGQPVVFAVTTGQGADVAPDTALTDGAGRAGARWVLGRDVGTQTASAALVSDGAEPPPSVVFSASASAAGASTIALVSGNNQSAPAGSTLADSLVVRVTDRFGNPVAGVSVTWAAIGGGSVSSAQSTTGGNGRAAVRRSLGQQAGEQRATATASGLSGSPVTFVHTATSGGGGGGGGGDQVSIVSGNNQTAPAGTELPAPLVIRVTDAAGRGLGGVTVAWIVTDGGGSVKPVITTTGGDGQASTRWTLGTSAGRNRVTAVVSGFGNEEFEARGTSGGGDDDDDRVVRLSFLVQPTDAQRDERLTPAVQVAAVNASGATVPGADGEVEMRLGQNPGDARLRGDRTERLDEGVAMFNDLRVDKEGDGFTLVASIAGLPEVESAPFRIDH